MGQWNHGKLTKGIQESAADNHFDIPETIRHSTGKHRNNSPE